MTTVFAPFYGEFGHMIFEHIRYVHAYVAERKIVCCERGQECLYPTASEFFYDWKNPIPDANKTRSGWYAYDENYNLERRATIEKIHQTFPGKVVIAHPRYPCFWHTSDAVKFKPAVKAFLPPVDIAIASRKRAFNSNRNYPYYDNLAEIFRDKGFKLGIVGARETSFDFESDTKAWHYPAGPTAGSVDILTNCKLYVGIDSGITHLAALMDVPTFYFNWEVHYDLSGVAERANKKFFHRYTGNPIDYVTLAEAVLDVIESKI